ncbi:hypothetical protein [Thioalkalivibrio sulfidiphilus]|uniref:Uncharacterized protein n=1 Tax=Thioalkalivibrio sulfidiphilus (strain HL-EbGR7) TaxID=396588 RepID=B8GTB1_THISH|nr:hypothetical protein [Thioalkalivibrio sulfidiphilus]ACL71171.1 hypothetical protein Tgr7_0067 [Thioalkalivibrio sulfidiphilus HL-EbGr7]
MSQSICKILFLKMPGAGDELSGGVVANLPADSVHHEFMEVSSGQYEAILDRLEAGVLPVVLKAPR